jgi:hypothetical protein
VGTPKAKELRKLEHIQVLRAAAEEADRVTGPVLQESAARLEESPRASATPISVALAAVRRRIDGIDREMLSVEKRRLAALARWELNAAHAYAHAQEQLLRYRRELEALIAKAPRG